MNTPPKGLVLKPSVRRSFERGRIRFIDNRDRRNPFAPAAILAVRKPSSRKSHHVIPVG